ncbi:MAG: secretin N-terminal domain-containing protein [Planctomycetaceae bacterium]
MSQPTSMKTSVWVSAVVSAVVIAAIVATATNDSLGQDAVAAPQTTASAAPNDAKERAARRAARSAEGKKPDGENKKSDGEAAEGKEKKEGEESKPDGPTTVKREAVSEPANPINEEVKWADDRAVQFSFHNQPWKNVLQWIADSSKLSLDWQELPGDALNLTTTRSYELDEARDLLNRHLLSRGYTMLLHGEILSVVKLSDLKSSLVPRVTPEQLDGMQDHTIAKVSFNLDWLIAEEAAEELKPMLTDAGRISKLSRTNRLEVIDTAVSLRDIWHILNAEQSDAGQEQLVKTFLLKHRRASDVIGLLRSLLGLEDPSAGGASKGMDPRMMQQAMQQMQQMMQKAQQNKGGTPAKKEQKTRMVLNHRENMILVQAAPDQMAIIEKALAEIDVPAASGNSMLQNMSRLKIYRLETVNPQTLVDLLQELGDLDPGTTLKVDKDKKAIVAWAGLADQLTITTLVERLDSTGREFDVIPLRRLDAEYVAGTIMTLMGPKEKEEDNSRSRYFGYGYGQQQEEDESDTTFRVDADLQDNRLLVYANPVEMDEIHRLLQKLGELPDPDGNNDGYRVFELNPNDDAEALKRQLEQLWRRDNKLEFNLPDKKEPDQEPATKDDTALQLNESGSAALVGFEDTNSSPAAADTSSEEDPDATSANIAERFFQQQARQQSPENGERPPVKISVSEDGRLIVACDDPTALAEFEELMQHIAKPVQSFKIFTMKYSSPYWVAMTLEEYFEMDEDEEDGGYRGYYYYNYGAGSRQKKTDKHSLSKRRIPQFIYDNYTSTILVRDADSRQLQTIEELIKIYDAPSPADTRTMRVTEIFGLKNAKAEIVAQAIKDVFRDLLSSNDKALEKPGGQQKQESSRGYSYFDGGTDDDDDDPVKFKGLLSIGIDRESNTLVISAQKRLMPTVNAMVDELDKAAERSSGVRILELDPTVDLGILQDRLSKILGTERGKNSRQNGQKNPNAKGQQVQPGRPGQNRGGDG